MENNSGFSITIWIAMVSNPLVHYTMSTAKLGNNFFSPMEMYWTTNEEVLNNVFLRSIRSIFAFSLDLISRTKFCLKHSLQSNYHAHTHLCSSIFLSMVVFHLHWLIHRTGRKLLNIFSKNLNPWNTHSRLALILWWSYGGFCTISDLFYWLWKYIETIFREFMSLKKGFQTMPTH